MSRSDEEQAFQIRAALPGQGWMVREWCVGISDPSDYIDHVVIAWQYSEQNMWQAVIYSNGDDMLITADDLTYWILWNPDDDSAEPPEDGTNVISSQDDAQKSSEMRGVLSRVRDHLRGNHGNCLASECDQIPPSHSTTSVCKQQHKEGHHHHCGLECKVLRETLASWGYTIDSPPK